jgi:hypothetical protein
MSGIQALLEQLVASKTGGHGFVPPRKAGRAYQNPALRGHGGLPAGQGPTDAQSQAHAALLQLAALSQRRGGARSLPAAPPAYTSSGMPSAAPQGLLDSPDIQHANQSDGTGGMLAPDEPPDAGGSQAGDPLRNFMLGLQQWSRGGRTGDRIGSLLGAQQQLDTSQQGLAAALKVNQSGNARAGRAFQTYDLGHGRMAHVYYDPKTGRRQVVKFQRPAA